MFPSLVYLLLFYMFHLLHSLPIYLPPPLPPQVPAATREGARPRGGARHLRGAALRQETRLEFER